MTQTSNMRNPDQDRNFTEGESPWIRRCCSDASVSGMPTERPIQDYEMQVLLCCQHNGRSNQIPATDSKLLSSSPAQKKPVNLLILEQLIRFCKNTSLRGVPRIVKAKDRKLRILWTIFFLIFLIGCISCVTLMVLQYLDHATMEKPSSKPHYPLNFPSITLCNTRPFSIRGYQLLKKHRIMTPPQYRNALLSKLVVAFRQFRFSKENKLSMSNVFLLSMFMQSLPKNIKPAMLGHRVDEMILSCNVMLTEGSITVDKPCEEVGTWVTTYNDIFLNCHTLTITNETESIKTMKVNMTVYLGERLKDPTSGKSCPDCSSGSYETQLDGVRLQIHEANTYPSVNEGGMYLSPGKLTEVEFTTRVIHMKEPPYGACKEDQPKNVTLNNHMFTFSRSACFISKLQNKIIKNCNCYSTEKPVPKEFLNVNYNSCREVILNSHLDAPLQQPGMDEEGNYYHDYLKRIIDRMECKINTESEYALEHRGCPKRCVFNEFETTISSTTWPTRSYQDRFLDSIVGLRDRALENLCGNFRRQLVDMKLKNSTYRDIISFNESNWSIEKCIAIAQLEHMSNITDTADFFMNIIKWKKPMNDTQQNETVKTTLNRMLRDEFFSDHFISLIVRRPHFGIKLVEEKEVITLTSLLSQVGGLLSIFIGLNFAIIVEIIELFYNIFQSIRNPDTAKL